MTDDEREADEKAILNALYDSRESFSGGGEEVGIDETAILVDHVPEIVLGLGFRRSEVPEPSGPWDSALSCFGHCDKEGWYSECVSKKADAELAQPQGEPSDAQVKAAVRAFSLRGFHVTSAVMRSALRAAGGVR